MYFAHRRRFITSCDNMFVFVPEWYLNPLLRRILEDYKDGRLRKRAQRVSQGTLRDHVVVLTNA